MMVWSDCFVKAEYLFKNIIGDIITWDKPDFAWPSAHYKSNVLKLKKNNYLIKMNPQRIF